MSDNLEVKNKVRKLLALSKSDNENEAAIALEKANELISKYEMDIGSLHFESISVKSTKTYVFWRTLIADAVAWLYCCTFYRETKYGEIVFVGEEFDAFMAGEMFKYLINTIERIAKKSIRKNAKIKFRRDFKSGMAVRLFERIKELGEACSWSFSRNRKIKEAEEFNEKSVTLCEPVIKNKIKKWNSTALVRGFSFGNNVSLARQAGHTPVAQITRKSREVTQGELF